MHDANYTERDEKVALLHCTHGRMYSEWMGFFCAMFLILSIDVKGQQGVMVSLDHKSLHIAIYLFLAETFFRCLIFFTLKINFKKIRTNIVKHGDNDTYVVAATCMSASDSIAAPL